MNRIALRSTGTRHPSLNPMSFVSSRIYSIGSLQRLNQFDVLGLRVFRGGFGIHELLPGIVLVLALYKSGAVSKLIL